MRIKEGAKLKGVRGIRGKKKGSGKRRKMIKGG